MKLHKIIPPIMHVKALSARVAIAFSAILLPSCMGILASKETYTASSNPATVNGAQVRMQVKAEGTGKGSFMFSAMVVGAGVASFDGPFKWRLEALGTEGEQQFMVVNAIRTHTEKTKRTEWYPRKYLGSRADFKKLSDQPGVTRAVFQIPGLLQVKPKEDGALRVTVVLTVYGQNGRGQRRTVDFRMQPSSTRQDEFIFLPTEIARSFGKPMEELDDPNWDR